MPRILLAAAGGNAFGVDDFWEAAGLDKEDERYYSETKDAAENCCDFEKITEFDFHDFI